MYSLTSSSIFPIAFECTEDVKNMKQRENTSNTAIRQV